MKLTHRHLRVIRDALIGAKRSMMLKNQPIGVSSRALSLTPGVQNRLNEISMLIAHLDSEIVTSSTDDTWDLQAN